MSDLSTGQIGKGVNDFVSLIQAELAKIEVMLSTSGANALDAVRGSFKTIEAHTAGIHRVHNAGVTASPTPAAAAPAPTPAPVVNPVVPPQTIPAPPTTKP